MVIYESVGDRGEIVAVSKVVRNTGVLFWPSRRLAVVNKNGVWIGPSAWREKEGKIKRQTRWLGAWGRVSCLVEGKNLTRFLLQTAFKSSEFWYAPAPQTIHAVAQTWSGLAGGWSSRRNSSDWRLCLWWITNPSATPIRIESFCIGSHGGKDFDYDRTGWCEFVGGYQLFRGTYCHPEDGGDIFLRNIYIISQHKRTQTTKISCLLWSLNVHYRFHTSLCLFVSQRQSVYW